MHLTGNVLQIARAPKPLTPNHGFVFLARQGHHDSNRKASDNDGSENVAAVPATFISKSCYVIVELNNAVKFQRS
jgi:hypothetical protein